MLNELISDTYTNVLFYIHTVGYELLSTRVDFIKSHNIKIIYRGIRVVITRRIIIVLYSIYCGIHVMHSQYSCMGLYHLRCDEITGGYLSSYQHVCFST